MSGWPPSFDPKPETWGAFVAYARQFGTQVVELDIPQLDDYGGSTLRVLRRVEDERLYEYPMPADCEPDRILRLRRMEQVARRLRIKAPKWCLTL